MATTRPVFVDTVTQVPADWANALTTLLYDVFQNATTAAAARQALGLGTLAAQSNNATNIVGGSIDNTPIGMQTPAQAVFTKASAQIDPVTDVDLVNLRSYRRLVQETLAPYIKSGGTAEKLYVSSVDPTSSASVPNTGWVDTRTIDKIKDAPLSRKILVIKEGVVLWEGFPIDEPFPENFEVTLLGSGATLPFNFFADEAVTSIGKDPAVVFKAPEGYRTLVPNAKPPSAEQPSYLEPATANNVYKVFKSGANIQLMFANANLNNLAVEVRYYHNTYNYLTMAPAQTLPTGPLLCAPAWADPINTPMGYLEGNKGVNVISDSHTVIRQAFIGCIVKSGVLGDSVVDWEMQWGPLLPAGAAFPPKLTRVSNTEAMIEFPKAVEDHYFDGCLKIKLKVNGVQMGYTQWITLSNMVAPNNFKDGRVSWGFDDPTAPPEPTPPTQP